jgi:hypothetical protein
MRSTSVGLLETNRGSESDLVKLSAEERREIIAAPAFGVVTVAVGTPIPW